MPFDANEEQRLKIIGLGETSVRKSYYPQLQDRMLELERFHALLDRSRELIILVESASKRIIDINATVCSLLEASKESLLESPLQQWLPFEVVDKIRLIEQEGETKGCCLIDTVIKNSQGAIPMEFVLQCVRFSDLDYVVILGKDISERKRAESKIHTLAFYDSLTHLPNRQLFNDRLAQALAQSQRHHKYGALIMIDLDNFKALNDTKGHHIGDELLKQVAFRIQSLLKDGDTLARIGGDEFVVLLEGVSFDGEETVLQSEQFALSVKHCINQPYTLLGYEHTCSPSIGVVLFNGHDKSKETLLKQADIAMYHAKKLGRNRVCQYDPAMQESVEHKTLMESELKAALSKQEFVLFYQPQIDAKGVIIGVEALVRWNHPTKGLIPPNLFIPLAEETGDIIALGAWVLREACRQLFLWLEKYPNLFLHVAINVSAKQFQETSFYDTVSSIVHEMHVPSSSITLELTESLILENVHEVIAKIEALRSLGVRFSLDDFGTGYSSLSYLKRLPLDELKIDQSFVRDINHDNNDAMIVKTIIEMAQNFDLDVIAEGVENEEQLMYLKENGCPLFQGYFFGKPMPPEEIERLFLAV
jgi:diguanylate cyclase (GGDEF)-like protein/PAS domain S-box-containing protein